MGGRDQQQPQPQQPQQEQQPVQQPLADGATTQELRHQRFDEATKSLDYIIEFSSGGKGTPEGLLKHIKICVGTYGDSLKTSMVDIAKYAKGDVVLEAAILIGMSLADQVHWALKAKSKISADALRGYLRTLPYSDVAKLGERPGLVAEVRKVLKNPIAQELPELADLEMTTYQFPEVLEWWLETTNPTAAALELAGIQDPKLTAALDGLAPTTPEAWGWLAHLDLAPHVNVGMALVVHRDNTKTAAAKTKLDGLVAKFKPTMSAREAGKADAKTDLATELSGTDDKALLDAAARTQGEGNTASADVTKRLKGESAEVVAQYIATLHHDTTLLQKVELLAQAKGARDIHLRNLFRAESNEDILKLLQDDVARKLVRDMMGKGTRLRDLLSVQHLEEVHATVLYDEALRQWWHEDPDPRSRLWLAAGSGKAASDGCRLVKDEKGNDWVKKLPRSSDVMQLRRFVLNTTDEKLATWVKANVLDDGAHVVGSDDSKVEDASTTVYGAGAKNRLDVATAYDAKHADPAMQPDPERILARLADLNESERAAILASKKEITKLFEDLVGIEIRAIWLLQPTLPQLLAMPIENRTELISYAAGRRMSEQLEAGENPNAARRVFGEISPFVALPLLRAPKNLAQVLEDNEPLLDWILETTEPNQALELLALDPVRKVAADLLEFRNSPHAGLPQFENLRKRGKEGFKAIAKDIKQDDAKIDATDYIDGNTVVPSDKDEKAAQDARDTSASTFKNASKKNLWDGIDHLNENGGSRADMISLVQASEASEQVELLASHEKSARRLMHKVRIGPQHVFIDLGISRLFGLKSSALWLLADEYPQTVLNYIGPLETVIPFAKALSEHPAEAAEFIGKLPRGASLSVEEQHTLDQVAMHVSNSATLRLLFSARFDTAITQGFTAGETRRLWTVLQRLPPAQVNQKVIRSFTEQKLGGPIGQWDPNLNTVDIEEDQKKLDGNDSHFSRGVTMTADEIKKYYGLDDKGLQKALDPKSGWITKEGNRYRVNEINPKQYTTTVLHEVGHSIDELLGSSTDLVYDLAGWKRYGYDQFETWANEMGAFEHISAKDKPKVIEAWQQSLRSKTAVSKLVSSDHPAVQDKKSPLSKFVDDDYAFAHGDSSLKPVGDRVFLQTPASLASVKKQTWDNAPTEYSMSAPAEFFAECYSEYYRGYDGTKDSEANKGGRLANWIKQWFDENVDNIRLYPQRVHGPKADNWTKENG